MEWVQQIASKLQWSFGVTVTALFLSLTGWGCYSTTVTTQFLQKETFQLKNEVPCFNLKHKSCSRRRLVQKGELLGVRIWNLAGETDRNNSTLLRFQSETFSRMRLVFQVTKRISLFNRKDSLCRNNFWNILPVGVSGTLCTFKGHSCPKASHCTELLFM